MATRIEYIEPSPLPDAGSHIQHAFSLDSQTVPSLYSLIHVKEEPMHVAALLAGTHHIVRYNNVFIPSQSPFLGKNAGLSLVPVQLHVAHNLEEALRHPDMQRYWMRTKRQDWDELNPEILLYHVQDFIRANQTPRKPLSSSFAESYVEFFSAINFSTRKEDFQKPPHEFDYLRKRIRDTK